MAENNNIQNVKIVPAEVNLRATSVRARLTDLVSVSKCGTPTEKHEALSRFDDAVATFKHVILMQVV